MLSQENLNSLKERATRIAREKGFTDNEKYPGKMLWLLITELAEATEADRESRICDWTKFNEEIDSMLFEDCYKKHIKDSFEAELAGAMVRLGHIAGTLNIEFQLDREIPEELKLADNFASQCALLLPLLATACEALEEHNAVINDNFDEETRKEFERQQSMDSTFMSRYAKSCSEECSDFLSDIAAGICFIAEKRNIDMWKHIDEELNYFQTRPMKHNKAY